MAKQKPAAVASLEEEHSPFKLTKKQLIFQNSANLQLRGTTFDATAFKTLGVDTLGNVITFDGGGGPSTPYTVNNGLSPCATNIKKSLFDI